MSENSLVYEITKMMNDKPAIQNDMNEAVGLVQKMFEEKYIGKINGILESHRERARSNPSREIGLLQAFKAFMPESDHQKVEKLIESLYMMETLSSIRKEYSAVVPNAMPNVAPSSAAPSKRQISPSDDKPVEVLETKDDVSVHSDGIYDVDNQCMVSKENKGFTFMPIFMLMSMKMQNR